MINNQDVSFLFDGVLSVAHYWGLFCGLMLGMSFFFSWLNGFPESEIRRMIFLVVVYFVVVLLTAVFVATLRIRAVRALKKNNEAEYLRFLESDKETRHEILGRLM